ncbi:hypothetical protein GCM10023322_38560 [Rugosimonospora acidiphila]|uniref:Carbon monoxide dehydrogenase subunit G n=1 Tax=Rugosimonospora acidiphila TaxID=556531 RepID=A0ABP9RVZ5_9ACTN
MRLDNEFVVPRPVDEAWTVLTDVERIAPCMPGAQLTEVVGDSYHGTVRIKVGPVVAQYGGAVRFTELDAERHRVVLEAKGKERSGRGLASALVTADLTGEDGGTRVKVSTDLTISGPLAQFGRGAIAEVSSRLLNQFVDQLKETVLRDGATTPDADARPTPAVPAPAPSPEATPTEAAATASTPAGTVTGAATHGTTAHGATAHGATAHDATVHEATTPQTAPEAPSGAPPETASGAASKDSASGTAASGATAPVPPRPASPGAGGPARAGEGAPAPPEPVAPANLLRVAAVPILKRLLPLLIVIVVIVVLLVVWLT